VTSQTALLQAQLQSLNLDTIQLTASVDLIRALGGGWEDSELPARGTRVAMK
jgi:outer membrane protein TolC